MQTTNKCGCRLAVASTCGCAMTGRTLLAAMMPRHTSLKCRRRKASTLLRLRFRIVFTATSTSWGRPAEEGNRADDVYVAAVQRHRNGRPQQHVTENQKLASKFRRRSER